MRFGILGSLLVHDGDTPVEVRSPLQRAVLAALLLHAGQPVAADALAEIVWDGKPPREAATTLRTHVMRLRRVLGPRVSARLVTQFPGYKIEAGDDEVDLFQFTRLVPALESLITEHPLYERFHGQLMLALYRSGRQAEALGTYDRVRARLVEEIGAEPGHHLRELRRRILAADPELAGPALAGLRSLGRPRPDGLTAADADHARAGSSLPPRELPASLRSTTSGCRVRTGTGRGCASSGAEQRRRQASSCLDRVLRRAPESGFSQKGPDSPCSQSALLVCGSPPPSRSPQGPP
ncbi:MAG: AfsR/SARP family transcriptional regulator [Streptosporangiaceae bacterium]